MGADCGKPEKLCSKDKREARLLPGCCARTSLRLPLAALDATCCSKRSKHASGREYFHQRRHAAEEAERLGHRHVGPEHVLFGVFRENGPEAATLTSARRAALRILGGLSSAYFVVSEDGSPTMSATCRAACRQSSADSAVAYDTLEGR
jgi:hypothetical protein